MIRLRKLKLLFPNIVRNVKSIEKSEAWKRFYLTFRISSKKSIEDNFIRKNSMTSPLKIRNRRNTDQLDDLDLTNKLSEDPSENGF